jgi:integrase/recombinase XerD
MERIWFFQLTFMYMKWRAEAVIHHNDARIAVYFDKNPDAIERIKKLPGAKWSSTLKAWHLPDNTEYRRRFGLEAKNITHQQIALKKEVILHLDNSSIEKLTAFENLLRIKKYSESTIKNYRNEFAIFLKTASGKVDIDTLTENQLNAYLLYLVKKKNYGESQLNTSVNALKFYYEKVSKMPRLYFSLPRPRKKHVLPKVIDKKSVFALLNAPDNLKHKTMLMCAYAAGLRVSEVASLKICDIDSQRMMIRIEQSKGKKDRYVMLSEKLLTQLREYFKEYRPKEYLFEGQYGGQMSVRSIQNVFAKAKQDAGILQPVGIHSLRHSFATHLHESGIDIKHIQDLLGHNSVKTTSIYTHVSNRTLSKIKSPFDD